MPNDMPGYWNGKRIIVSPHLTETVRLTWRERLLSWPWRPWVATKKFASGHIYDIIGDSLVVSAETYRKLMGDHRG